MRTLFHAHTLAWQQDTGASAAAAWLGAAAAPGVQLRFHGGTVRGPLPLCGQWAPGSKVTLGVTTLAGGKCAICALARIAARAVPAAFCSAGHSTRLRGAQQLPWVDRSGAGLGLQQSSSGALVPLLPRCALTTDGLRACLGHGKQISVRLCCRGSTGAHLRLCRFSEGLAQLCLRLEQARKVQRDEEAFRV